MKGNEPSHTGNVIPFHMPSENRRRPLDDARRDNIIRMLDLSKFEQPRPAVENKVSMRANIAALILLGLLVYLAKEDFRNLERANLCAHRSECLY